MTDHHEALKTEERKLRSRIVSIDLFAVDLPLRHPFKHAACERSSSESLFIKCITDHGVTGYGESLPREYVTGETRDSAYQLLRDRILPRLLDKSFDSLDEVKIFLESCDGKAPLDWVSPNCIHPSAWCAVDLALLDTFGREFKESALKIGTALLPNYSAVLSQESGLKLLASALKIKLFGFQQVKMKTSEIRGLDSIVRLRKILGKKIDIRIDANMAWNKEEAIFAIKTLSGHGISFFEQPVPANELDVMASLVRECGVKIIADEGFTNRESLKKLIEKNACTGVNIRISKCGGVMAALARAHESREAGLEIQIGCHVGESSLLSAAQLAFASSVPKIKFMEGCFGLLLLKEDPFEPILQFGWGGHPPRRPEGCGWGVEVDERVLRRYTVHHDVIKKSGR